MNAALPAESWQSYDVLFTAARWTDGAKSEPARVSVWWNGIRVHDNVSIADSTPGAEGESPAPGPLVLQDHGDAVRYCNVWVTPL